MISLTQVKVLATRAGQPRCELGPDESTEQGKSSTDKPDSQDQKGSVHAQGNHVGVDENAGADNAAHDDHGGVEYSEQLSRFDGVQRISHREPLSSRKTSRRIADVTAITLPWAC